MLLFGRTFQNLPAGGIWERFADLSPRIPEQNMEVGIPVGIFKPHALRETLRLGDSGTADSIYSVDSVFITETT